MSRQESDLQYMRHAFELARRGTGRVSPNPLVGCVIVDGTGNVIGEGAHEEFGGPHAEVLSIRDAESHGHSVEGSTMYITLEPHSFHGKTPPCTGLIISKKISRCVVAMEDPNPRVAGEGVRQLKKAGVSVKVGVLEEEAREQNRFFIKYMTKGMPYVTLKLAMSLDGRSAHADGQPMWITSEVSRRLVHAMRAEHDAVMIGTKTALIDDPQLTVRYGRVGRQPWRIVLDTHNQLPDTLRLFRDDLSDRTLRITAGRGDAMSVDGHSIQVKSHGDLLDLHETFEALGERGIASILVEAGPTLAESIVKQNLFDEIVIFQAPITLGDKARPAIGEMSITELAITNRLHTQSVEPVEDTGDIQIRLRRTELIGSA